MCGRYTLSTVDSNILQVEFGLETAPKNLMPRYNIAPSQPVPVVVADETGVRHLDAFHWGLIPVWAKDPKIGYKMINARAETLAEKSSFKVSFRRHRCLILTDGFYEWQKTADGKQPVFIHRKDRRVFAFAGLFSRWMSPGGDEVLSCTIITTQPNTLLAPVHNRMPVILPPDARQAWLSPTEQSPAQLQQLLVPYPSAELDFYPVSKYVNYPSNDSPTCIEPLSK